MSLTLKRETALDLTLQGSIGSFNVGTGRPGQNSLEVKYFLTHVGLDFSFGSNEKVLQHLAPVREIFDFEHLDFDEIMQRDIDDARVSSELIPYLLDARSTDLVKLFPPIVVVVLPIKEHESRPAPLYPKVEEDRNTGQDHDTYILRSGVIGGEAFQFEQPILEEKRLTHDLVKLKLNTQKTRLVIVDGQHRAMALLALYRNLKDEWSNEKRAPFKEYYSEWTPSYIQAFELKEINLPVMFCTFPQLCEGYSGDFDLKKAARTIFLTLNKTARKVSNSRNILLDDNDIIAAFLRKCLSEVKKKNIRSPFGFRIFNVELDQSDDRMKIQSPIAVTGVSHIYYIIEHLLLNKMDEDVNGAKPRHGKFFKRTDLNTISAMTRLNGRNLLGAEVADTTRRDSFADSSEEMLSDIFNKKYGKYIIDMFERFTPYEAQCRAVLDLEQKLEVNEDRKLRPILFEGQGIGKVFNAHRESLKQKLQEGDFQTDAPNIQSICKRLDATADRIDKAQDYLRNERATRFLNSISDKKSLRLGDENWHPKLVTFLNDLYSNVFTTVAFQAALICGFFGEIERAELPRQKQGQSKLDVEDCFRDYMSKLNDFFTPRTPVQLKKLISLFAGDLDGTISEWKLAPSPHTFKSVVYRGEMQPDQWPKYKYLLLEIWRPTEPILAQSLTGEREKCRHQIFRSLYEEFKTLYATENKKHEDALEEGDRKAILDKTYDTYKGFLRLVSPGEDIPKESDLKSELYKSDDANKIEMESDLWESAPD